MRKMILGCVLERRDDLSRTHLAHAGARTAARGRNHSGVAGDDAPHSGEAPRRDAARRPGQRRMARQPHRAFARRRFSILIREGAGGSGEIPHPVIRPLRQITGCRIEGYWPVFAEPPVTVTFTSVVVQQQPEPPPPLPE